MRTGWSCGHADVRGDRTPGMGVWSPTVRRHQHGHVVVPAVAPRTWQRVRRAAGRGARDRCCRRSRPPPSEVSMSASGPHGDPGRLCGNRSGPAADTAGHFRCGRPACRPGSGHPRTRCRLRCHPAGAVATGTGRRGAAAGGQGANHLNRRRRTASLGKPFVRGKVHFSSCRGRSLVRCGRSQHIANEVVDRSWRAASGS